ncbi:MAG: hypothetical protein LBL93_01050, partial [Ruminococcus sp.]|nr:hypothetical protein [Ruminococcus sp.]
MKLKRIVAGVVALTMVSSMAGVSPVINKVIEKIGIGNSEDNGAIKVEAAADPNYYTNASADFATKISDLEGDAADDLVTYTIKEEETVVLTDGLTLTAIDAKKTSTHANDNFEISVLGTLDISGGDITASVEGVTTLTASEDATIIVPGWVKYVAPEDITLENPNGKEGYLLSESGVKIPVKPYNRIGEVGTVSAAASVFADTLIEKLSTTGTFYIPGGAGATKASVSAADTDEAKAKAEAYVVNAIKTTVGYVGLPFMFEGDDVYNAIYNTK